MKELIGIKIVTLPTLKTMNVRSRNCNYKLILFIILVSCNSCQQNRNEQKNDLQEIDTIDKSGIIETKIETDSSLHIYYGDSSRTDSVICFHSNGKKFYKEVYLDKSPYLTIYYGLNGNVTSEHYRIEGHITGQSQISYNFYIVVYGFNGDIIEKGIQGEYKGASVPMGTWFKYRNGKLIQEIFYHNDDFGKDYISYKNTKEDGSYEKIVTNNFILYETDSVILSNQEYLKRIKK